MRKRGLLGNEEVGEDEAGEGSDVARETSLLEGCHIVGSLVHRDDPPWVTDRHQHHIHNETCRAPIAIYIRMDEDEEEMS